tara:strand:+ start:1207 stop:1428 length:222 start_codon:yes stop_codon:yes gene_type:complete
MICPLCHKDLTEPIKILGEKSAFNLHVLAHIAEHEEKVDIYISEHLEEFSPGFLQLISKREEDLKTLKGVLEC